MSNDQMKSEVTVVFRKDLPGSLPQVMSAHFRRASAPVTTCAVGTALDGLAMLNRVAFAEDTGTTASFYIEEDVRSFKLHIERRNSTQFSSFENELKEMKEIVDNAITGMSRFAKARKNGIADVKVIISCGDVQMISARRKKYRERLKESVKANLAAKVATPFGTAVVGLVFTQDATGALKAFFTGCAAVIVASLLEALMADAFKYERS
ncbi:hypothetical protein [Paraburkholderia sp. D1E]|uniref:hypothetical protein n=1 Tax=Paraburkholderia sp. D1E TaxID=3461398 RepID=UPI00404524AF